MGLRASVAKILFASVMTCNDLRENELDHRRYIESWDDHRLDALEDGYKERADIYTQMIRALEECQAMLPGRHESAVQVYKRVELYYGNLLRS